MINIILTRILVFFLVIYLVNMIYKKFLQQNGAQRRSKNVGKREYTDYDREEWEKIKKSLED
ncbi:MAG: hypothetical protein JW938_03540 [Candidatus Omnitrophica bacterium]|nr:hypothetical protein [Candidatus Omnitrophota bacterium]